MSFWQQVLAFVQDPVNWQGPDGIPARVGQHVVMSVASTATAVALALPVGVWLGHVGRGGTLAINVSNVGRAVPSFAILVIALLVFGGDVVPAFVSLVALAIPPIVTNAYVGMRGVDADLKEAARGLGMRERAVLLRVELPVAVPVVMAGIRTAGVQVVATATLAALVGWGGLGRYIVDGLANGDDAKVFVGSVLVALLAGSTELFLAGLQQLSTPRGLRHRTRGGERVPGAPALGPAI